MADTIAVMNAGPDRAAGRPGHALRAPAARPSSPTSSASPTCCRGTVHGHATATTWCVDVAGPAARACRAARSASTTGRRLARRAAGEAPASRRRAGRTPATSSTGDGHRRVLHRRLHAVPRPAAVGPGAHRRPAERRHARRCARRTRSCRAAGPPQHGFGLDAAQDAHAGVERGRATSRRRSGARVMSAVAHVGHATPRRRRPRGRRPQRSPVPAAAAGPGLAGRLLRRADGLPGLAVAADRVARARATRSPGTVSTYVDALHAVLRRSSSARSSTPAPPRCSRC